MNLSASHKSRPSLDQAHQGPRVTTDLLLAPDQAQEARRLLSLGEQVDLEDEAATLMTFKAPFDNGWYAEFKIVNADSGPSCHGSLRDVEGAPLAFIDDTQDLLGEHAFEVEGIRYVVTVAAEPAAEDQQTPAAGSLRGMASQQAQRQSPTPRDLAILDIRLWLDKAEAEAEWLDGLVHDMAAATATEKMNQEARESAKETILAEHEHQASGINNRGLEAQITYLVDQLGPKAARKHIAKCILAAQGVEGPAQDRMPVPSPAEAKARVKALLEALGLPFEKLSAKSTSFSGFGYGTGLFVKIHGWKPNPALGAMEEAMKGSGIVIQTDHGIS